MKDFSIFSIGIGVALGLAYKYMSESECGCNNNAAQVSPSGTMGRVSESGPCQIEVWTNYVNGVATPIEVMVCPDGSTYVNWPRGR